jgi:hypothetical protein
MRTLLHDELRDDMEEQLTGGGDGDAAAVAELIADMEGELRLHQVRISEFLDGTSDFPPVTSPGERARLLRVAQVLKEAVDGLGDIAGRARA